MYLRNVHKNEAMEVDHSYHQRKIGGVIGEKKKNKKILSN